jgi:hypothetical protein
MRVSDSKREPQSLRPTGEEQEALPVALERGANIRPRGKDRPPRRAALLNPAFDLNSGPKYGRAAPAHCASFASTVSSA